METIEFKIKDDDFISLGNRAHNIKLSRDIEPEKFIEIYKKITEEYEFQITQDFYQKFKEERTAFGKKQYVGIDPLEYIIDFLIQCNTLLEKGIEISPLFNEFRKSGDIYQLRHSCSLSYLTSIYALNGYEIKFLTYSSGKSPDFSINGISSDLKVIQQSDLEAIHMRKGREFRTNLSEDICYDIGMSIRDRLCEGIKQSDLVFIDLGSKSLTSLYLEEKFDSSSEVLPEPKKCRVIYFCRIGPNIFIGRKGTFSFFGVFIDFDINIWNYIRNSHRIITHKIVGGKF